MAENKKEKWIEVGTLITILVPMFYTAGWSYAYHYFDCFHLGLIGLDIPKEYFFVYSFWAVEDNFVIFLAMLPVLASAYFFLDYIFQKDTTGSGKTSAVFKALSVILIPVFILGMFWLFYFFGDVSAKKSYKEQLEGIEIYDKNKKRFERISFPSYPQIKAWVKVDKENGITEAMVQEWQKGSYRLLLKNKRNVYLFYPVQKREKAPTYIIPMRKIEAVSVLSVYESCQ